jgi:hypothetical protein
MNDRSANSVIPKNSPNMYPTCPSCKRECAPYATWGAQIIAEVGSFCHLLHGSLA